MAVGDGLISVTPSSISNTDGTATINANGGVNLSAVTIININGVFTSSYDNYLIVVQDICAGSADPDVYLRASGVDATTNYTTQYALGTSAFNAGRVTRIRAFNTSNVANGSHYFIYGPYLAQPTAFREIRARGLTNAYLDENASWHSTSSSYDGITIDWNTTCTGTIHVFGYEE